MTTQSNAPQATNSTWLTYENGILLLLGFTFGLIFFDRNAVSILTPFFQEELSLSNTHLGMLSSGLALSWALSAYIVSSFSDKAGVRKPFILISVLVFSVCSAISGFAASFAFLICARILMGLAEGPFLPISLSIMNKVSSPNRRGFNAGILQNVFASLLGTALAPIVLVNLAELYGWRVAFYLTGIPGLICAYLIWHFLKEPEGGSDSKEEDSDKVEGANEKAGIIASLGMLKYHNILICSLISICMVAWFLVALTFLPIFFTAYRGFTPQEMGGLMSVIGVCTVICGFIIPALSDRVGRKPIMIIFCFIGMLTPLAALYFTGPMWMLGALMFIGWSGTSTFPLFMGVIPGESVSPALAASSMGLVVAIGELVGGVGAPSITGWFADQNGLQAPVYAIASFAFIAGVLSLFLKETAPSRVKS